MPTIKETVLHKISQSNTQVSDRVIDTLVEREIDKRSSALINAIEVIEKSKKELNKINRADNITYVADAANPGQQIKVESYTETRWKQIESFKQKLSNLETAFDDCLNKNDDTSYEKLAKAIQTLGNSNGGESKSSENKQSS